MRIKKWEKWYWRIVLAVIIGLLVWIILREKGFVVTDKKTGETKEWSKLWSGFVVLLNIIPIAWLWALLRFWLLKTNDFICKYCRKEYGGSFETEKEVCRDCYETKKKKKNSN